MSPKITIPKDEQLAALANGVPALYRLIEKYTGGPTRADFRQFVNVSKSELADYLRANPALARKHVQSESQVRLKHDQPLLLDEDGKWLVCWIEHGSKVEKTYYDDLSEAGANFLMAHW